MTSHNYDLSVPTFDIHPVQHYCRRCQRMTDDTQPCLDADPEPSAPLLREATEAEDDLIQRLSVAVGHRLLRDWEDLPTELQVLPMNRAFLAALALSMGRFLGAVAANDPDNADGWRVLVEQSVEIVRQTADTARELIVAQRGPFQPGGTLPGAIKRALVPEPKLVM